MMTDFMNNKTRYKYPVNDIFEGISGYLKFLSELGFNGLDCSDKNLELIEAWGTAGTKESRFSSGLNNNFLKCRKCSLSKDNQQIVCGEGNQKARLAIVGGVVSSEDMQNGKPYSGKAGDLLNKMISAMNLTRDDIYITRAVKCCVPAGQKPKMADVNVCKSYLDKELRLVKPDIICAFGQTAAMALLETSVPVSRLRGRFHDYRGMRVMPTYSPEYLLENVEAKRVVWEDLKQVIGAMEKIVKGK